MPHPISPIEHAVGIYIGLLLLACFVGIIAKLVTQLPYTIFLTVVGLVIAVLDLVLEQVGIGSLHLGSELRKIGFGHDLIFFVFLPPLLFQGAMHMDLDRLLKHIGPIICFAVPGVLVSTLLVGGLFGWLCGISSIMVAMLFGALISPTDPVSVLALFREAEAPEDLRTLVEGESLLNDATGVVLFSILLTAVTTGADLSMPVAAWSFAKVSVGGLLLGGGLGWGAFAVLRRLDDHLLENAICLVLAYGAFWLAEVLGVSGVISTAMAGLLIGNQGRRLAMSRRTTETVETFFESIDFLVNSFLFILIGLELSDVAHGTPMATARLVIVAIAAMLIGRAAVAYPFYWLLNQVGTRRPKAWKHILFWGGLRGSIPIALLLHLPGADKLPEGNPLAALRPALLVAGFACVSFSLLVQGTTTRPLLRLLRIGGAPDHAARESSARGDP
ncbi:MAG: sodium:proton antiporter [Phycisphaerae bacterium]|nr:sodium:proton antiporter [Phycisphaerae bacterium]